MEDDESIREGFESLLVDEGFKVSHAGNGKIALDMLASMSPLPDLIILDLMMPVMDGFAFRKIQQANTEYQGIPVLVVSASFKYSDIINDLQVAEFLPKPVDLHHFLAVVNAIINKSK